MRRVLQEDWNPVGCEGLPEGEFDAYVWPLLGLLRNGASQEALLSRLREIELRWFGGAANEVRLVHVVDKLRSLGLAKKGTQS